MDILEDQWSGQRDLTGELQYTLQGKIIRKVVVEGVVVVGSDDGRCGGDC